MIRIQCAGLGEQAPRFREIPLRVPEVSKVIQQIRVRRGFCHGAFVFPLGKPELPLPIVQDRKRVGDPLLFRVHVAGSLQLQNRMRVLSVSRETQTCFSADSRLIRG